MFIIVSKSLKLFGSWLSWDSKCASLCCPVFWSDLLKSIEIYWFSISSVRITSFPWWHRMASHRIAKAERLYRDVGAYAIPGGSEERRRWLGKWLEVTGGHWTAQFGEIVSGDSAGFGYSPGQKICNWWLWFALVFNSLISKIQWWTVQAFDLVLK